MKIIFQKLIAYQEKLNNEINKIENYEQSTSQLMERRNKCIV